MTPQILRRMAALEYLYKLTQRDLIVITLSWDANQLDTFLRDANAIVDRLDTQSAVLVRDLVHRVVTYETRLAERLLKVPPLTVTPQMMNAIDRRFYLTFAQQHQQIRTNVTEVVTKGWQRGMSLEAKQTLTKAVLNEGITGLVRADGSRLSVEATGKAMVRTRTNQLQAESQLARYREAEVEMVEYASGGICRFDGEGGTCNDLDGERFPIDAIPDYAEIPRHLYSMSRWLPVTTNLDSSL
jgi:hypothetical protein